MLTKEEIKKLPTIIDVLETLSEKENERLFDDFELNFQSPLSFFNDEYKFQMVAKSREDRRPMLKPCSLSSFIFYRGQNKFFEECYPTLYRGNPSEDEIIVSRLKACELGILIFEHHAFREYASNYYVDFESVAQHYGLKTEYIDITNNKWVAAFFATTKCENNVYSPVGEDFGDGYGVIYVYDPDVILDSEFEKNLSNIGYCYFERPSRQYSFGYHVGKGKDFNDLAVFKKIFFRHDLKSSEIVFATTCEQKRFIPNDKLSELADDIAKSNVVSKQCIDFCSSYYKYDKVKLEEVCRNFGLTIKEHPGVKWPEEILQRDLEQWNRKGRSELASRIAPTILIRSV